MIKAVQQVTTALVYGGIYQLGLNQASIMDRIGLLSLIAIGELVFFHRISIALSDIYLSLFDKTGTMNLSMASTIRSFPKEKYVRSIFNLFDIFVENDLIWCVL